MQTNRLTSQRIQPHPLVYPIVVLILFAAAPPAKSDPNQHLKISPSLRFHAPSETLKVWVFFVDKGFATPTDQRRALEQYQNQMSDQLKRRRELRAHYSQPDLTDPAP